MTSLQFEGKYNIRKGLVSMPNKNQEGEPAVRQKKYQSRNILDFNILKSFLSGGIAGVVAKTSVAPIERVKLIFQTSNNKFTYRKGYHCFKNILEKEGILSL